MAGQSEFAHLQPAQDDDEHPLHPEELPEEGSPEPFPRPNFESRFCVSFEPQKGHSTTGFEPKTSFSKHLPQAAH